MDGYLTNPFLKKLPNNLKTSWLPGKSTFSDFFKSVTNGALQAAVSDECFVEFITELEQMEPDIAKTLRSLESSGKIKGININETIPKEMNIPGIRNGIKKHISGGLNIPSDIIFHDDIDNPTAKEIISKSIQRPLFLEVDLTDGTVEYMFTERSFSLNITDPFNWSRFISNFTLPFQKIRILDPHLYKNIRSVDIAGLLKTITKKSENVIVEIISKGSDNHIKKAEQELRSITNFKADVLIYKQLSDVSNTFHKRTIWTDYWVLLAERGFDFLDMKKGLGKVKKETNLYLTGKYASRESIWYQIDKNWEQYLKQSRLVKKLILH